jgi:hypothetical protein
MKEYRDGRHPIVPGIQIRAEMMSSIRIGDDGSPIEWKTSYEITKVLNTIYPDRSEQMRFF